MARPKPEKVSVDQVLRLVNSITSQEQKQLFQQMKLKDLQNETMIDFLPKEAMEHVASTKPIWNEFDDILSTIPTDALERLPRDAAENHDYYLYGKAKDK